MFPKRFLSLVLINALMVLSPNASAASSLAGKSCKTLKAKITSGGASFTCSLVKSKKIWVATAKPTVKAPTILNAPSMPIVQFESYFDDKGASGDPFIIINAITGITDDYLSKNKITGFNFQFELPSGKLTPSGFISVDNYLSSKTTPSYKIWYIYLPITKDEMGKSFKGKVQIVNASGTSDWLSAYTKSLPSQSATPTPSATSEVGCSVNYLSALPYSNQRIAITGMAWEKDPNGYVSAIFNMRNDNSMSLRLVEFTFYLMHKGSVVTTQSTLQGNHFFIQDDSRFNSIDGTPGAWLAGQTRNFRINTNQILECRSIMLLSSGFNVRQGIGAN